MERVVIVFGGSVLAPAEPDPTFLAAVADRLKAWSKERMLFVVVGGGSPARRYIGAARQCHVGEDLLDRIGIQATRLNAQTLAAVLAARGVDVNLEVPTTVTQAVRLAGQHRVIVMGGTVPGHSTDCVGAELAYEAGALRFVNATNVDGVYTRDPKKHADAKRVDKLDFETLLQIIEEREWSTAGAPGVFDGPATVRIATAGIPTRVVLGTDLANLERAVKGETFVGSAIDGAAVVLE